MALLESTRALADRGEATRLPPARARSGSVLVPVVDVERVPVAVVDVVHVVAVLDRLMAAAVSVLVVVARVDGVAAERALVPVVEVRLVDVPVVQVVGVIAVLDGDVPAALTVLVGVIRMYHVLGCHGRNRTVRLRGCANEKWTCATRMPRA